MKSVKNMNQNGKTQQRISYLNTGSQKMFSFDLISFLPGSGAAQKILPICLVLLQVSGSFASPSGVQKNRKQPIKVSDTKKQFKQRQESQIEESGKSSLSSSESRIETELNEAQNLTQILPRLKVDPSDYLATPSFFLTSMKGTQVQLSAVNQEFNMKARGESYGLSLPYTLKFKKSISEGQVAATYGVNENFYFGIGAGYGMSNETSNTESGNVQLSKTMNESKGISDPVLAAGGRINSRQVSLVFELGLRPSLTSTQETVYVTSKNNENEGTSDYSSGRSLIRPTMMIFSNSKNNFLWGASLSSNLLLEGKFEEKRISTDSNNRTNTRIEQTKKMGGHSYEGSLFVETPQYTHSVGFKLNYSSFDSKKIVTLSNDQIDSEITESGYKTVAASIYGNFKITSDTQLIPSLGYTEFKDFKIDLGTPNSIESIYAYQIGLALKSKF